MYFRRLFPELEVSQTHLFSAVCHLVFALFVIPMQISGKRLFQSPIFLQFRVKSRGQRGLKVTLVRGYNLESLWLCLLQNKVEELNQRLRQAMDGQCFMMLSVFHTVYQTLQDDSKLKLPCDYKISLEMEFILPVNKQTNKKSHGHLVINSTKHSSQELLNYLMGQFSQK